MILESNNTFFMAPLMKSVSKFLIHKKILLKK